MKVTISKKVTNSEPSTIKSNLQKLQAVKKVTKVTKTTCHYGVFFVIKQPPAYILTGVVVKSYV
jgi:hypothetical protein